VTEKVTTIEVPLGLAVAESVKAYVTVGELAVFCNVKAEAVKLEALTTSLKFNVIWCVFKFRAQLFKTGAVVSAV
jgi:hypothetical protein